MHASLRRKSAIPTCLCGRSFTWSITAHRGQRSRSSSSRSSSIRAVLPVSAVADTEGRPRLQWCSSARDASCCCVPAWCSRLCSRAQFSIDTFRDGAVVVYARTQGMRRTEVVALKSPFLIFGAVPWACLAVAHTTHVSCVVQLRRSIAFCRASEIE